MLLLKTVLYPTVSESIMSAVTPVPSVNNPLILTNDDNPRVDLTALTSLSSRILRAKLVITPVVKVLSPVL